MTNVDRVSTRVPTPRIRCGWSAVTSLERSCGPDARTDLAVIDATVGLIAGAVLGPVFADTRRCGPMREQTRVVPVGDIVGWYHRGRSRCPSEDLPTGPPSCASCRPVRGYPTRRRAGPGGQPRGVPGPTWVDITAPSSLCCEPDHPPAATPNP